MVDVQPAPSRAASGEPPAAPLFTVVTPTFNRAATLQRVYRLQWLIGLPIAALSVRRDRAKTRGRR